MDILFQDFKDAHLNCSGPLLANTINPVAPPNDPTRLKRLYGSSSILAIQTDIRAGLLAHTKTELRFSKSEGNAWVDVYITYWTAIGEILVVEDGESASWPAVYDAWKEVANALIKGYSSAGFESWTIPCLYITGRYLRAFAIKADEHLRNASDAPFSDGMQDDVAENTGKNEKLEEAARNINRMFTLCISDRYVAIRFMIKTSIEGYHQGTTWRV